MENWNYMYYRSIRKFETNLFKICNLGEGERLFRRFLVLRRGFFNFDISLFDNTGSFVLNE